MKNFVTNIKLFFNSLNLEALFWLTALLFLAVLPSTGTAHFTICPAANLGIDWCPGCGLGSSISLFFNGKFIESALMHPFGIPAVLILSARIISLVEENITNVYLKNKEWK